jgi:type VII secretion-associated protein (TIGR03931 family)
VIVVEVGPSTIRGPNVSQPERVTAAIECIDDDIGWMDDHPVTAAQLWCDVMRDAVGGSADTVLLVCPTWWPASWIRVVSDAASAVTATVEVRSRAGLFDASTVVEIAPDLVVIAQPGQDVDAVVRRGDIDGDAAAVVARLADVATVVLDVPEGVDEGRRLGESIGNRLKAKGIEVVCADREYLRRAVQALRQPEDARDSVEPRSARFGRRATAVLAGTLLSLAALGGGFAGRGGSADEMSTMLLVEGRVGVTVPARWTVSRVTNGPGSARLQVVSPADGDVAVHITQSVLPSQQTMEAMAESLRSAFNDQPTGVFVDLNTGGRYLDKPAVTYREVRQDREIAWVVLVDKTVRIAIGCQSPRGHEQLVREACDRAVGSAHAVF